MLTLNVSALPHTGQSGRRLLFFPEISPNRALICDVLSSHAKVSELCLRPWLFGRLQSQVEDFSRNDKDAGAECPQGTKWKAQQEQESLEKS